MNDAGSQENDDNEDDCHNDTDDGDQLDVLPPVLAGHFLRGGLEVFRLQWKEGDRPSTLSAGDAEESLFAPQGGADGSEFKCELSLYSTAVWDQSVLTQGLKLTKC